MSSFTQRFKVIPPVTLTLIIVNLAIYAVCLILPSVGDTLYDEGAVSLLAVLDGKWWTLLSAMFLHAGIMHIVCNMLSLYYLGVMCEKVFGAAKFAILYFASGIAGNVAFVAVNYLTGDPLGAAVGASGAIFGLFGAYGYLLIREYKSTRIFAMRPARADIQSYLMILVINLMVGLASGSGIANEAHIGGMITGIVVGAILYAVISKRYPPRGSISQSQMIYPQDKSQHPRY